MTKKNAMVGALMILAVGPVIAGRQTPEPFRPAPSPLEKLESAVRLDQFLVENPAFGTKSTVADARREEAKVKLAKDQAALDAFKTAGPSDALKEAIAYDRWEMETGGYESKFIQREARKQAARERLAQHEAALK